MESEVIKGTASSIIKKTESKTTRGFELLSSLFLSKAKAGPKGTSKNLIFDIPALYFKSWCEDKTFPKVEATQCIYGLFAHEQIVRNYIETYYSDEEMLQEQASNENYYKENVNQFRKKVIREIIFDLEPLWLVDDKEDYISANDVSNFMQGVGKNRIWSDADIKSQTQVLYSYMAGASCDWNEENESKILGKDEQMESDLESHGLEFLEKKAWKECILDDYKTYVDNINLNFLKNILRDHLNRPFIPKGWQEELLIKMKRLNFIASSRRGGKTFVATYLCARQLYIPNQVIVYICPNLRTHAKVPWRYLFMMLKSDPNISFNRSDWTITNRKNGSEIIFISGEREDSVRGQAANLLVFDEAAFLSEELYETAMPLIRTTNGIVFCITTVNPKAPKNWFYYKLIDAEISKYDIDSYKYGRRVTLRENPFIPEAEKYKIADEGKMNMKLFNCEWMAEFQDGDSFNFSKFWILDYRPVEVMVGGTWLLNLRDEVMDKSFEKYSHYIICHDSGKLKDKPGLSVLGVKLKPNAQGVLVQDGVEIVASGYMSGFEYRDQVKLIMDLRKLLGEQKTTIVIEYNQNGVVVEEMFRRQYNVDVIPVQVVGGVYYDRDGRIWRVGKDLMISKFTGAIERGVIKGYSFMENLRIEVETYDLTNNEQNRKHGHHYDILSSIFVGNFFADKMGYLERYTDKPEDVAMDMIVNSVPPERDVNFGFPTRQSSDIDRIEKFGY